MKTPNANAKPSPVIRCAIYTRKSTEEGLEKEFNSLDAQRESGELFVRSQAGEGWTLVPDAYDDGGFTGGNMERPALRRLMLDIEAGKIDAVVVYKVDRLSRNLLDFARIMQVFDGRKVSFVSVTTAQRGRWRSPCTRPGSGRSPGNWRHPRRRSKYEHAADDRGAFRTAGPGVPQSARDRTGAPPAGGTGPGAACSPADGLGPAL